MFNSVVLNVFIGLVFIYLLYSLLATILQEMLARWFNLRSRMLQKSIRRMLEDSRKISHLTLVNALSSISLSIVRFFNPDYRSASHFTKAFFDYPSIKYLGENSWHSKPAYLSPSNFSATLIHLLLGNFHDDTSPKINLIRETLFATGTFQLLSKPPRTIDNETLHQLQKIFLDSKNDLDRFKALLEDWFNDIMNAANGWYKNQCKLMLFFIGLLLAGIFNVDSIAIYRLLANDKTARENLVQLAVASSPRYAELKNQLSDSPLVSAAVLRADTTQSAGKDTVVITRIAAVPDSTLDNARALVMSDLVNAGNIAALGWPVKDSCKVCDSLNAQLQTTTNPEESKKIQAQIKRYNMLYNCQGNPYQLKKYICLGWILTALAISLGATFWFDLLNRIISLRSAGQKPDPADTGNPAKPSNTANPSQPNRVG